MHIKINEENIDIVETYKYLGTVIDNKLSRADQCTTGPTKNVFS